MNTKYIFAIGRIDRDSSVIHVTCPAILEDCRELGRLDARDGDPCQPRKWVSALGCVEAYCIGWHDEMTRNEAALAEYEREPAIEDDHDFIRHGGC